MQGMSSALIGPVLPDIQQQISLPDTGNVSFVFVGRGLGGVIGATIAGILHRSGPSDVISIGSELGWFALSMGTLAMGMAAMLEKLRLLAVDAPKTDV